MSVFRPAVRVTSPDGRTWEIYAYKIRVREREAPGPDDPDAWGTFTIDLWLVDALLWLLLLVPRGLARLLDVAVAALRSVRSDEWTIDAIDFQPPETVYSWTTTSEFKGQVLAQVEGHLARGDVPVHLTNAVFRGQDRRSER